MKALLFSIVAAGLMAAVPASAETTECTEIKSIPTAITVQGVYCFKQNLGTAMTSGNAIDIQTNNVTIDFNGYKLGGLAGGLSTNAVGVFSRNRLNITLRNGNIRGFHTGILLQQSSGETSSGHLVEDMIMDGNRDVGISVQGTGLVVRNNRVVNTGPSYFYHVARGIVVEDADNGLVVGNLISKTQDTMSATGISVLHSALLEIRGNSVLETGASDNSGITLNGVSDTTIVDNRVLNATGTGTEGIHATVGSKNINCIDNTVAGFNTALTGCDLSAGNHTAP